MPQNVVVGKQAAQVAEFVARYAGHQAATGPGVTPCGDKPIGSLTQPSTLVQSHP
jgi:hypothetical protein